MIDTPSDPPGLPELTVVVPLHDEEENVGPLIAALESALAGATRGFEVVAVDDGSSDRSGAILLEAAADRPWLRVLRMNRRRGQSAALTAGLRHARAPIIVTMDADLQNDPADIPLLLEALEGCDVVSGVRVDRHDSWLRRASSRVANRVRRWGTGDSLTDIGCALKAYRAEVLREIPIFDGLHRFLPVLAARNGARLREVAVRHHPRERGRSHYGVHNRLWRGVADLFGVRWLQARWISDATVREIEAGPSPRIEDGAD